MGAGLSYPTVDLGGKVAVVTGANSGIGYETAKALAVMGAQTFLACRSEKLVTEAMERMRREVAEKQPDTQLSLESLPLDLSSFRSTQEFVAAFRARNCPLHILINNAGIAMTPQGRTDDGYERQFQVNHLSHFLLTLELLPIIAETAASSGDCRILFVSSNAHELWGVFDPDNMNGEQSYDRFKFYGNSKLYNIMTAHALQRRLQDAGVTVSSIHPGAVQTGIHRSAAGSSRALELLGRFVMAMPGFTKAEEGAATSINCAVNPELNSRQCYYYYRCRPTESSPASRNEELQEQLWEISVDIVKDYLSPEVLRQYGAALTAGSTGQQQRDEATADQSPAEEETAQEGEGAGQVQGEPTDIHTP